MLVTDLDGTLLNSQGQLSAGNRATLHDLGTRDVLRVVATGRNLHSACQALNAEMPIDYLVFASGAGTMAWPGGDLLNARHLDERAASKAAEYLIARGLDFMLHAAVPDNHHFWYHGDRHKNPDFARRIERYRDYSEVWPDVVPNGPFSQLLAVQAHDVAEQDAVQQHELQRELAPLNVIRATSPLDHRSTWFEVFAPGVSKAAGAQWLFAAMTSPPARCWPLATIITMRTCWHGRPRLRWLPMRHSS